MAFLRWIFLGGVALGMLPFVLIVADGLHDERHASDLAVVFGNTVNPDGRPSPRLRARLDAALGLYRDGLVPRILVSGGFGVEGFDEADSMAEYLIGKGVPAEKILRDHDGVDSWETARATAAIVERDRLRSVTVVSQYFHISRSKLAMRRFGIRAVYGVHGPRFEKLDPLWITREVAGYGFYLARART